MRGDGSGNEHTNLFSFLRYPSSAQSPQKVALVDSKTHQTLSYQQLWISVSSAATGMSSILKLVKGDTIMLLLPNCLHFPIIFLAATRLGLVVTTANPLYTSNELLKQARDSSALFIFTSGELADKVASLGLPLVLVNPPTFPRKFIPFSSLLETTSETLSTSAEHRTTGKKTSGERQVLSRSSAEHPLPSGALKTSTEHHELELELDSTAALLYSSGTTGVSKGVILTHGNLISAVNILVHARKEGLVMSGDEVVLGVLPFFHIAGLIYEVLSSVYSGATLVVAERFELVEIFQTVERYRVNYMVCVPPMLIAFTKNHLLGKKYDLSSWRYAICGAAPLGRETHEAFLRLYPHIKCFPQAYGMTETTGVGFGISKDSLCGSAGRVMPFCEAKVVDIETGNSLPPFHQGELCLRGPSIMKGYFNNPKATSDTIDEVGWLHTGDLVYLDIEGNMFVMDRLKELIKYKAFQVAPAELEALLLSHPLIKDCAVVPFPDEEAGEIPLAYVVRAPSTSISEAHIIKFVSDQVAPHKKIRIVRFLDAIPKSATGKLLRKELIKLSRSKL